MSEKALGGVGWIRKYVRRNVREKLRKDKKKKMAGLNKTKELITLETFDQIRKLKLVKSFRKISNTQNFDRFVDYLID